MNIGVGMVGYMILGRGKTMRIAAWGPCMFLALVAFLPAQAQGGNSDTPGVGSPAPPGAYERNRIVPSSGVLIFHDREPGGDWRNGVLAPIQSVLEDRGVSVTVLPSSEMGTADLTPFLKVITTSVQPPAFWNALEANRSRFEAYVEGGGVLELHLASFSSETNEGKVFPGGFVVNHHGNNYNRVAIDYAFHPILTMPNAVTGEELQNWDYSAHGFFFTLPPDAGVIIREDETVDRNPVTAELPLGSGKIVATVQPIEWDGASAHFRENMVLFRPGSGVEIALELVGCNPCVPGDQLTAVATVFNSGLLPQTVEIKGGVRLPDGTPFSLLPGRHIEMAIPPGISGPISVLNVVIPPGIPEGEYKAEAALITPALGTELSRTQVPVPVTAPPPPPPPPPPPLSSESNG